MLKIRLARFGKRGQPSYRIIVKEKRSKRDGTYVENLGTYHPLSRTHTFKLDQKRYKFWLDRGAQPTQTIRHLAKKSAEYK